MWGLCGAEIAAARVVSRCVRALVSRGLHLLDSGVADAVVARRLSILELLELPEPMLLGRMAMFISVARKLSCRLDMFGHEPA